jgi:hypothetical protein
VNSFEKSAVIIILIINLFPISSGLIIVNNFYNNECEKNRINYIYSNIYRGLYSYCVIRTVNMPALYVYTLVREVINNNSNFIQAAWLEENYASSIR